MSEAKNTALGSRACIGYSHVVPATHRPTPTSTLMIAITVVLTALVLLVAWDSAAL